MFPSLRGVKKNECTVILQEEEEEHQGQGKGGDDGVVPVDKLPKEEEDGDGDGDGDADAVMHVAVTEVKDAGTEEVTGANDANSTSAAEEVGKVKEEAITEDHLGVDHQSDSIKVETGTTEAEAEAAAAAGEETSQNKETQNSGSSSKSELPSRSRPSLENGRSTSNITESEDYTVTDNVQNMWTAEEDLRLLDAISTLGLGNWMDISEEVAGTSGTTNKNPKRCMERYLYDFCGNYGEILPSYTLVEVKDDDKVNASISEDAVTGDVATADPDDGHDHPDAVPSSTGADADADVGPDAEVDAAVGRKRKRSEMTPSRQSSVSSTSSTSHFKSHTGKEYKVVATCNLPGYKKIWPRPYVPPVNGVKAGDDVGRDLAARAEQAYVKAITAASTKEEAKAIREDWEKNRLNKYGGPTVLPPRADDVCDMQGSDLAGFMPRRGDFDIEWDNEAEKLLMDMEFLPNDSKEDVELKLKVLEIYNSRLDNRNNRKQFLIDRGLLDYRKKHREDSKLPSDERDLVNRMRLFARFHSPDEHEKLIEDLLKAKRMRKEIARLQMYRRMGFTSMADAERFELDRNRREIHRMACEQREKEEKKAQENLKDIEGGGLGALSATELNASYLKQYKQNDRNKRKGINSAAPLVSSDMKTDESGEVVANEKGATDADKSGQEFIEPFNIREYEGFELLSKKEVNLCQKLRLKPKLYIEAKTALINESLNHGMLDAEESSRRSIFKVDIEKRGDVFDFMLQAGWVPSLPHSWHGK